MPNAVLPALLVLRVVREARADELVDLIQRHPPRRAAPDRHHYERVVRIRRLLVRRRRRR